jgi:hypothetical protein
VTVFWRLKEAAPEDAIYCVEQLYKLSEISNELDLARVTQTYKLGDIELPKFRARVICSFNILGYDDTVYVPPVGVEGDIAFLKDAFYFCPDQAISIKEGKQIIAVVDPSCVEIFTDLA